MDCPAATSGPAVRSGGRPGSPVRTCRTHSARHSRTRAGRASQTSRESTPRGGPGRHCPERRRPRTRVHRPAAGGRSRVPGAVRYRAPGPAVHCRAPGPSGTPSTCSGRGARPWPVDLRSGSGPSGRPVPRGRRLRRHAARPVPCQGLRCVPTRARTPSERPRPRWRGRPWLGARRWRCSSVHGVRSGLCDSMQFTCSTPELAPRRIRYIVMALATGVCTGAIHGSGGQ